MVTTTPDTVFKKMVDYVPILPNDSRKWTFCLPTMYYNALTEEVKTEMDLQGYTAPQSSLLLSKEDQIQSMSKCRAIAVQSLKKVLQDEKGLASLISE